MKHIKKYLLIAAGFISLALGIIGIVTPILPTTPFLLLTAYCFMKSSDRLHNWLIHHRVFGPYIYNYFKYHAISKRTKIIALIFLWVSLTVSIIILSNLLLKIILLAIGIGVSIHILLLKTLSAEILNKALKEINK